MKLKDNAKKTNRNEAKNEAEKLLKTLERIKNEPETNRIEPENEPGHVVENKGSLKLGQIVYRKLGVGGPMAIKSSMTIGQDSSGGATEFSPWREPWDNGAPPFSPALARLRERGDRYAVGEGSFGRTHVYNRACQL